MESEIIQQTERPVTRQSIVADLRELGVKPGMTLLVHSSLSSLGWVCGGAQAVLLALKDATGESGTLVMPAHSSALSDPAQWSNPPVPKHWWPEIREQMPAFDPEMTPTRQMGAIAELFRTLPGVLRSSHPQFSFAALGPQAESITANHQLDMGLGEGSPLARIYELGGYVLLLGVGHDSNTSIHLAEYRSASATLTGSTASNASKTIVEGAPVMHQGQRTWKSIKNLDLNNDDFAEIGQALEQTNSNDNQSAEDVPTVRLGSVGNAQSKLIVQPKLVDFATKWMVNHRS